MPTFETVRISVCNDCLLYIANGDLPVDFPEFHADPSEVGPDEVDWHPDHIHADDIGEWPASLGWHLHAGALNDDGTDREGEEYSTWACEGCGSRLAGRREPATAMRPALKVEVHYGEDVWDSSGALVNPWGEDEARFETDPSQFCQTVLLICRDIARADEDPSVLGSSWEVLEDMAYTVTQQWTAGQTVKALIAEGYDVTENPNTVELHG